MRAPVTDEVEFLDEDFLHHLNLGAGLLTKGDAAAAVNALQRARALRPTDPHVLGLVGQALYEIGRFDDSVDAFQRLVDVSPAEAAARVNLGLANLRARRHHHAVRQFEIALDLSPDHRRAMRYLGLAWLESGEPARARPWFERAGSPDMVARCDALLARPPSEQQAQQPGEQPPLEGTGPARPARAKEGGDPVQQVLPLPLRDEAPFTRRRDLLTVAVDGEVLARADGLLATRGSVRLLASLRRFRGSGISSPFGDGAQRMLRASGRGELVYAVGGKRLVSIALHAEAAYFREAAVFAFEGRLSFENGRFPLRAGDGAGAGIDVVRLSGDGQVLLASSMDLVAVTVDRDAPLSVIPGALVGWTGALAPQLMVLAVQGERETPGAERTVVELTGTGRVLLEGGAAS